MSSITNTDVGPVVGLEVVEQRADHLGQRHLMGQLRRRRPTDTGDERLERGDHRGPQLDRVVVHLLQRQPRGRHLAVVHPVRQQLGLAGSGRRDHQASAAGVVTSSRQRSSRGRWTKYSGTTGGAA